MECQVRTMASSSLTEDVTIPEGKVESVCREWLVREDSVLAYKLQSEEIQHHYGHNREKNQLVRSDLKEAQSAQKSEEEEATLMRLTYERMLKEQEDRDAFLAQQLQERILREEMEQQRQVEEEDKKIAKELQKKEKLRLQRKREEREIKQAEKVKAELSGASNSSSIKSVEDLVAMRDACTSPLEKRLSAMNLEPPPNLTPEELQKFIENRDAELAKLLHEQEMKSGGDDYLDRQIAVEAQDRELAKVLQEQERARARKAREKAKQRAALAQQQESRVLADTPSQSSEGAENESNSVKERLRSPDWNTVDNRNFASSYSGDPVSNVAAALDPTFNGGNSPFSSPSSSASSPVANVPPYIAGMREGIFMENEESIAPPYMPIQGTRRPSSLEKKKKSKKTKDSCKTQ